MKQLVLSPHTRDQIEAFTAKPAHALLLTGPTGSGKYSLARLLAEEVLRLQEGGFETYPYGLRIRSEDGKAIGIESARQLEQFLSLKVPGAEAYDRAVIIEDAHLLTTEAQNALLKTLEEPPEGTLLILTATHEQAVLPTIRSRTQLIPVGKMERSALEEHFIAQGFKAEAIQKTYAVSGGLPGLMYALLHDAEHPLAIATERARQLLSGTAFERLMVVDDLAKQKALAIDVMAIMQQMARLSLQTATGTAAQRWQSVLSASYEAGEALLANAQPKLVLTKLMLNL